MTSTIKVNNIQNQCGQNIINENSNTITIGASGDTIALASGASQTGFGKSGAVDWQTTIKTGDFTAVSGEGYFVNSTSGGITVTLPSSPSAGAIVGIKDYANTADTNNITIGRNSSNIDGTAANAIIANEGGSIILVYADATKGWLVVEAAQKSDLGFPAFIAATGGTVTTVCTNFKVHTFTGPGTFCVSAVGNASGSNTVDYMVVAAGGGGGGGGRSGAQGGGGGGGAGGFRESSGAASGSYTASPLGSCVSALPVSVTGYPIAVGGGGSGASGENAGGDGAVSTFSSITSTGGGGGGQSFGHTPYSPNKPGRPGGSGGGGGTADNSSYGAGGTGNTPSVTPPQGRAGGPGYEPGGGPPGWSGAGGGGATAAGADSAPTAGGNGGAGATSSINGTPTARAGGGGGASGGTYGSGGTGGGGGGSTPVNGAPGTANTGGGAGGAYAVCGTGGNGGDGIVIIRYKFQ